MLTQLKCEGDIAEQLAPKYITHSSSLSQLIFPVLVFKWILTMLIIFLYYIYFILFLNLLFSLTMLVVSL